MLAEGDRFALEFAAQAAEVADDVDCGLRLRARLGAKRVPGLERNRARQLLDPRLKRIGNPREKAPALARNRARTRQERHRPRLAPRARRPRRPLVGPRRSGAGAPDPRPRAPRLKRYQPTSHRSTCALS